VRKVRRTDITGGKEKKSDRISSPQRLISVTQRRIYQVGSSAVFWDVDVITFAVATGARRARLACVCDYSIRTHPPLIT